MPIGQNSQWSNQLFGWELEEGGVWSLYDQSGEKALSVAEAGSIVFFALPTADPGVEGQLWAKNGVLMVSGG